MGNIVLIGAGGTGMSGVAGILMDLGFNKIVCIDSHESQLTMNLEKKSKTQGFKVIIGHGIYTVKKDDVVIYSEATVDSIEVKTMKKHFEDSIVDGTSIKRPVFCMNYFGFLGEISKYFITIGFAGTNGKSSSTALAIDSFAKFIPDFGLGILGALVSEFDNCSYIYNKKYQNNIRSIFDFIFFGRPEIDHKLIKKYVFLVEACEYKGHFLNLNLDYSIITNIKLDHTDYFNDYDHYFLFYTKFVEKTKYKVFMLNGFEEKDKMMSLYKEKICSVDCTESDFKYLIGKHHKYNASLVKNLIFYIYKNLDNEALDKNILNFKGVWRRMEYLGNIGNDALLFSDYGHVAESIGLGFVALREKFPDKKIISIFQPHQMNRVVREWDMFIQELKKYDNIFIYDIYAAREDINDIKMSNKLFVNINSILQLGQLFANKIGAEYIEEFDVLINRIISYDDEYVVVIYTAGDLDYKLRCFLSIL